MSSALGGGRRRNRRSNQGCPPPQEGRQFGLHETLSKQNHNKNKTNGSQACWLTFVIPALGMLRQEDIQESEVSLSYIVCSRVSTKLSRQPTASSLRPRRHPSPMPENRGFRHAPASALPAPRCGRLLCTCQARRAAPESQGCRSDPADTRSP